MEKLIESLDKTVKHIDELLKVMKSIGDEEKESSFIQAYSFLNYKVFYDMKLKAEELLNELLQSRDPQGIRVLKIRE